MAHSTLNILVIDDDKGDRMSCRRALKSTWGGNLRFLEADNGESGLESVERHVFSCVLLDHSLPGINGVEVLKRIRIKHPYLPVIMIDGKGNDVVAVQSMKEGAQDYIAKSTITPQRLHRAVLMAIKHGALQKHAHEQRTSLDIFTRALAHDLKEPVRTIRSFLERITDKHNLCDNSRRYFQYVNEAADRMGALIDAVHFYTRLDAAEQMQKTFCDITCVLEDVQGNLAQLIKERAAIITYAALPQVHANQVQMVQLFQNLLTNAIRHCKSSVTIVVSAEEHEDHWRMMVRDNGPGIDLEHLEMIFHPFKRASHRKEDEPGLGLGLAITRKIVELHGGRIWCESQPGAGTSFLFTWPKRTAVAAGTNASALTASANKQAAGMGQPVAHILLVDDNAGDIVLNSIILIDEPKLRCDLLTASDGKEALAMLRDAKKKDSPIELVVLDINMPILSGFELLTQMQKEQMLADTLVVMCSTSDSDMDERMAESLGATGYLGKPPEFAALKDIINGSGRLRFGRDGDEQTLLRAA
jgi:signal transduction histidine kinase